MRISEADILIVPGYAGSPRDHWQTRWEQKLSTARRVEQRSWDEPDRDAWTTAVADAVNASERPVVIVAHSLGVAAVVHAVPLFRRPVSGAFLVSPPDVGNPEIEPASLRAFGPYPREPLPFPSVVIASRNDPWMGFHTAQALARRWDSTLVDAGDCGHINAESHLGDWSFGREQLALLLDRPLATPNHPASQGNSASSVPLEQQSVSPG